MRGPAVIHVQFLHPCSQELMAFSDCPSEFVQLVFRLLRKIVLLKGLPKAIQSLAQIRVLAFEALKRLGERSEPPRFHERFSCQAEEPIQTIRGQSNDALGFLLPQGDCL
jgi:hypothetical protein